MPDLNKAILDKHPSLLYYNDPECQLPVIRQITVFGICEDKSSEWCQEILPGRSHHETANEEGQGPNY